MATPAENPPAPAFHALKPKLRKLAELTPHPKNPNTHPQSQVDGLGAAFDEFGITSVIVVDEKGMILAGAGRVLAGQAKGIIALPVIEVRGWSERKKLAFMVSDNQWSRLSSWDGDVLRANIRELQLGNFELGLIGFDPPSVLELLAVRNEGDADPDEAAPAAAANPIVRVGDLWILGEHRLLCGDSTKRLDVDRVVDGAKPKVTVTDPPYGVAYDPSWRADANKWKGSRVKIGGKAMGKVKNDHQANWRETWELMPTDVIYAWSSPLHAIEAATGMVEAGYALRSQIIWNKTRLVIGRGDYHWQHEQCWYAVRIGKTGHWQGDRTQSTVWDIPHQASETGHGTQKPIECMKRPIENNTRAGEHVYEPFCGSGTTVIACEMTGRKCIAIELDPAYVQVTIERWQAFTGKEATLNGKTLEQVTKARRRNRPPAPAGGVNGNGAADVATPPK